MSVTKRNDSPFYVIDFIYKGKRFKRSSGSRLKARALAIEAEWKKKLEAGDSIEVKQSITFGEAVERYLQTVIAPKGDLFQVHQARIRFNQLLKYIPKETEVHLITERDVFRVHEEFLSRALKPNTINRYLGDLGTLLRRCERDWQVISRAPRMPRLRQGAPKDRVLSTEEEKRLLQCASLHFRRLLIFLLGTGARRSEAMNLKWSEVDLQTEKRTNVQFLNTKNGRHHGLPVPTQVAEMLHEMYEDRPENFEYVFYFPSPVERTGTNLLPPLYKGQPLQFRHPDSMFAIVRAEANLSDVTMHTLRHTYASRLIMAGVSIFEVSKLLNHSSIEQTMRYAHLAPNHLEGAVSTLDEAIDLPF